MIRTRLDAPIVLAHGLFGFTRIGWGVLTLAEYFKDVPRALRERGNRVFVTRVHPTADIAWRARKLAERIESVYPEGPFHLIGHSMGGLDARLLLDDPAWRRRVLSLTTIGTPHRGSPLAVAASRRLGWIYRRIHRMGWNTAGFEDVFPSTCRRRDRRFPRPADLPCFSLAGVPDVAKVCAPMRPFHAWLEDRIGPNDGLVPRESALAFGDPLPDTPLDHLQQMNWFRPEFHGQPAALSMYQTVLANLARLGFGESVLGEGPEVATLPRRPGLFDGLRIG